MTELYTFLIITLAMFLGIIGVIAFVSYGLVSLQRANKQDDISVKEITERLFERGKK